MEALRSGRAVTGSVSFRKLRWPRVPIRSPRVYDNDSDYVGSSRSRLPSMSRHCDRILSKKREKTQSIEVKVVVRAVGTPHLCSSVREEGRRDGRSRCCCIWRTEKEGKMAAGISALSTTDSVVNNVSPWRRSRRYLQGPTPISKRFYKREESFLADPPCTYENFLSPNHRYVDSRRW
ncbi:hypothetical protein HZH66_008831 [Vespula vulgaris]|uniref:Uncharacterized protein n=1 Tax=Vespula vulgaris TaxID=7454 RepID=A0A834JQ97_VESVU|nr:hypothetical protein HZH66_008831 [Vespula vulgaris]